MKKVLFLANHRLNRSPGQRFRFEQYFDYLNDNGFQCELSPLLSIKDDKLFYSKGNWISKLFIFIKCFNKRLIDVKRAKEFDVIFIFREAFFTGTTYFERKISREGVKVIFDFDDSIWIPNISPANKRLEWLKNYAKTREIIELSDMIFAGNRYLADYAEKYNDDVHVIPTTIDTDYHKGDVNKRERNKFCIGWTGTNTTIQHFEYALPVLKRIKEKFKDKVYFKLIGETNYYNEQLKLKGVKWNVSSEIEDLQEIDIGIMPLPDDKWTKGKCGFKGLQYMALEIPTIMSPVGVNTEIITDGENGFLARTEDEWFDKLSLLIESKELRAQFGKAGRKTVIEKYAVDSNKEKYLACFENVLKI